MKRSTVETLLGAVILITAGLFFFYSMKMGGVSTSQDEYVVTADFSEIGGLKPGDSVQISGVKVGTVANVELMPDSFLARVFMSIKNGVELPADTSAIISSESLLGGRYLALQPGADQDVLQAGDHIQYTQAPQNLEQLLGQFIFNSSGDSSDQ